MEKRTSFCEISGVCFGVAVLVIRKILPFTIGFDITTPPPVSGDETPLGDIFTLSNAVEPPPELWGDDDDAECVEC